MILTPDRRLRVFISSTLDLLDERAAARRAVDSLNLSSVMFEAGARPHPPRALYRAYVEQSDVFVAIYATRYGWTAPDMDVSGLEDEFNLSTQMPRLVYIQTGVDREPELTQFLERVRDAGLSYRPFATATELERLLKDDLVALLTERFHLGRPDAAVGTEQPRTLAPLPTPPTPLLGRERDVKAVRQELDRAEGGLVTLIGPGGIGKTRLAIECGRELEEAFADGVFFVGLEALREPQLVGDALAAGLGVATSDAYPAARAVADFVRESRMLLVLDNFEQVVAAASFVAGLLSSCPRLAILVTSRAPLRLRGERVFQVDPLPVPETPAVLGGPGPDTGDGALACVQLFVASARDVRPDFQLDEKTTAVVLEICRRLDGVPLAIELAAAMMRMLTPAMLLDRLEQPLGAIASGPRDLPERHQRLDDTIAWSYDLLDDAEQELFARLAVFRGGFTLTAAEEICGVETDVLAGVGALVEQSLVRADVAHDEARFSMLGSIRRYAWDRLEESSSRDEVVRRHRDAFVRLLHVVGHAGGRRTSSLDAVETELDNVRRSLEQALADDAPDLVARAMWDSWWFWWTRGYVREGKLWSDRCLASPSIDRESRAAGVCARAMLAIWSGEYELAVAGFQEASGLAREFGDVRMSAYADIGLGLVTAVASSVTAGVTLIRRGTTGLEGIRDEEGVASGLAATSWVQGITREFDDSEAFFLEARERAEQVGSDMDLGIIEAALTQYRMSRGETEGVYELIGSSLDHVAGTRHIGSTILTLEIIAELGLAADLPARSLALLQATGAIRSAMGTRVPAQAAARLRQLREVAHERLGHDLHTASAKEPSSPTFADVVDQGRGLLEELSRGTQTVVQGQDTVG